MVILIITLYDTKLFTYKIQKVRKPKTLSLLYKTMNTVLIITL